MECKKANLRRTEGGFALFWHDFEGEEHMAKLPWSFGVCMRYIHGGWRNAPAFLKKERAA